MLPVVNFRNAICFMEQKIKEHPDAQIGDSCPLKHTFVEGAYVREIFMPKGIFIVTKIHKKTHPFFIMQGDVSILTEEGVMRVQAPYHGITLAGTKRFIYMHEDTVWITVHATDETSLEKIEDEIIAKTFEEIPQEVEKS